MSNYKYDLLDNVCYKNKDKIESINSNYTKLLSQLTKTEIISNDLFMDKINEISKIGDIIVCYKEEKSSIIIVGSGTIIYEPKIIHNCRYVGHIEDIIVDDQHRANGIASNIISMLIDKAKNKCYKVILNCKEDLIYFYEKNKFFKTGNAMALYLM